MSIRFYVHDSTAGDATIDKIGAPNIADGVLHTHANKTALDNIVNNGSSSTFLSADGTYKSVIGAGMIYNPNHFYIKNAAGATDTNTYTDVLDCLQAVSQLGNLSNTNRALIEVSPTGDTQIDIVLPFYVDLLLHSGARIGTLTLDSGDNRIHGYGDISECVIQNSNISIDAYRISNLHFTGNCENITINSVFIDYIDIINNSLMSSTIYAKHIIAAGFAGAEGFCKIYNANFVNDHGNNITNNSVGFRLYLVKCHLKSNTFNINLENEGSMLIDNCIMHSDASYCVDTNANSVIHVLGTLANKEANPNVVQTLPDELIIFNNLYLD